MPSRDRKRRAAAQGRSLCACVTALSLCAAILSTDAWLLPRTQVGPRVRTIGGTARKGYLLVRPRALGTVNTNREQTHARPRRWSR